jgi:hypothetical protein
VGILCGSGLLPVRAAESLARRGSRVVAVCIKGEADRAIEQTAHETHWAGLARLGAWVRFFKAACVDVILMCGAIRKERMFENKAALMPDWRTVRFWYGRLRSREDHTILGAVADEFEKEGIRVGSVPQYCPELIAPEGRLTRRGPGRRHWRDIRFAWPIAKHIAALQVGQCVVVKDQAVIAVEGIDGTDAVLKRGGALCRGEAVAVKVPKEGHDERFDIPAVGPETVSTLKEAGIAVFAVEAGRTILLDADEVRRRADAARICIIALTEGQLLDGAGERPDHLATQGPYSAPGEIRP